jgi:preprotein translocase subunit SecE
MELMKRVWDPVRDVGAKVHAFFREVRVEFGKVSWPNRREVTGSTTVVIVVVLVLALFLFLVDQVFATVVHQLFKLVGFRS